MIEWGHRFQIKYLVWWEIDTEVAGPKAKVFQFQVQCTFLHPTRVHHVFITPQTLEVTHFVANVYSMPEEKEKEKRKTLKSFRTPLLSTVLYKIARRFLSQPGQDKQNLSIFHDWIVCVCVCCGERGRENESISKQSKAKRDLIIFPEMKRTCFYLFRGISQQASVFFSSIQQIFLVLNQTEVKIKKKHWPNNSTFGNWSEGKTIHI